MPTSQKSANLQQCILHLSALNSNSTFILELPKKHPDLQFYCSIMHPPSHSWPEEREIYFHTSLFEHSSAPKRQVFFVGSVKLCWIDLVPLVRWQIAPALSTLNRLFPGSWRSAFAYVVAFVFAFVFFLYWSLPFFLTLSFICLPPL